MEETNSQKFHNESEIKSLDKSDNISIDPNELFKEINFSPERKLSEGLKRGYSPIVHPINKFSYFESGKNIILSGKNRINEKRNSCQNKDLLRGVKKVVLNYGTVEYKNNININFNNVFNIFPNKEEPRSTNNYQNKIFLNNIHENIGNNLPNNHNNRVTNKINDLIENMNFSRTKTTNFPQKLSNPSQYTNSVVNSSNSFGNKANDFFTSLLKNEQGKNKNLQLIADKVKKISEKKSMKNSLIINLNQNYRLQEICKRQNNSELKRNINDKLQDIFSKNKVEEDSFFDFNCKNHNFINEKNIIKEKPDDIILSDDEIKSKKNTEGNHSNEEILTENNEKDKVKFNEDISKNTDRPFPSHRISSQEKSKF